MQALLQSNIDLVMRSVLVEDFALDKLAREVVRVAHEVLVSRVGSVKVDQGLAVEAYVRVREVLSGCAASSPDFCDASGKNRQQVYGLADDLAMAYFMVAIVRVEENGFEYGLTEVLRNALIPVLQKHFSTGDIDGA